MEVLLCVCYRPRLVGDLHVRHGTGVRRPASPVPHPHHPGGSQTHPTVLLLARRAASAPQALLLHPLRRRDARHRRRRRERLRRGLRERHERGQKRLSGSKCGQSAQFLSERNVPCFISTA